MWHGNKFRKMDRLKRPFKVELKPRQLAASWSVARRYFPGPPVPFPCPSPAHLPCTRAVSSHWTSADHYVMSSIIIQWQTTAKMSHDIWHYDVCKLSQITHYTAQHMAAKHSLFGVRCCRPPHYWWEWAGLHAKLNLARTIQRRIKNYLFSPSLQTGKPLHRLFLAYGFITEFINCTCNSASLLQHLE